MALLGHTIVEAGLARLQAFWPQATRDTRLRLRPSPNLSHDQASLNTATALYSGRTALSPEDFAALTWLPHFAGSGRQLLMCHALRLLEGWNAQPAIRYPLQQESEILLRLASSAGAFAATLESTLIEPLCLALQNHIAKFLALRAQNSRELLTKALTLIEVSRAIEEGGFLAKEAARILDLALPDLVAADGGPMQHELCDFVSWVSLLLDADDILVLPLSRYALDRARPFLSMLLQQNLVFCFNRNLKPNPAILATTPMRLAPASGVARLAAGKSVVISLPHHLNTETSLHISSHHHWLFNVSHFLQESSENMTQNVLRANSGDEGQLLHQVTENTNRTVFLSPKGDDLRVEDIVSADGATRWMHIYMNTEARLSIARNGTAATIAADGRNLWQLTLRGARILPATDNGKLLIQTTGNTGRINWALKRINRNTSRANKRETPELPF